MRYRLRALAVPGAVVGLASTAALGGPQFVGPYGPGGTYQVFELINTPLTWDEARVAAKGMSLNGVQGSLTSIGSADENRFLQSITNGNWWIGLHDSDQTSTLDGQVMGGTERGAARDGWLWTNGDTYSYQNWGDGEPNDWPNHVPPGEDAVHIRGDGRWNDDRTGPSLGNAAGANNNYIVKYAVNTVAPPISGFVPGPSGAAGTWGVREIILNNDMGNIADATQSAVFTRNATKTVRDYQAPVLNIWDNGGRGNYVGDSDYRMVTLGLAPDPDPPGGGGDDQDDINHVAVVATGRVRIPRSGVWTFGVNSDDGFRLSIAGKAFNTPTNGEIINGSLVFYDGRGTANSLGQVTLAAGDYDIQLLNWEGGGGAAVEVFAAEGAHTAFNHNFNLIGAQGFTKKGPKVNTPFNVAVIRNGANNLDAAIAQGTQHIQTPGSVPNTTTATAQTIAFTDPSANSGNFPGGRETPVAFPGDGPGDDNNFATVVTGTITVDPADAGTYTFAVYSDDSFRFRLPGTSGWTAAGGAGSFAIADGFQTSGCCDDAVGTINLAAGDYNLELIANEMTGGAGLGVWVAEGTFTSFDPARFQLLGANLNLTTPAGLELVDVPEPGTMTLMGLGAMTLILRRRRR
jgi:hypothetical protein